MSRQQRQDLARVEAENKNLRDELALIRWERDGARKREVILAINCQKLIHRAEALEQEIADWAKRTDDMREAWRFELRRADTAELEAAKAKADAAAAELVAAVERDNAEAATQVAQKAHAHAAALAAELLDVQASVQRLHDQAVTAGMEREFRP